MPQRGSLGTRVSSEEGPADTEPSSYIIGLPPSLRGLRRFRMLVDFGLSKLA
jgi:hypothetical protein